MKPEPTVTRMARLLRRGVWVVGAAVTGCQGNPAAPTPSAAPAPAPPTPTAPRVTLAQYDRINRGMTRPEVVAILGSPGVKEVVPGPDPAADTLYWRNPDGSNLYVEFEEGKAEMVGHNNLKRAGGGRRRVAAQKTSRPTASPNSRPARFCMVHTSGR